MVGECGLLNTLIEQVVLWDHRAQVQQPVLYTDVELLVLHFSEFEHANRVFVPKKIVKEINKYILYGDLFSVAFILNCHHGS